MMSEPEDPTVLHVLPGDVLVVYSAQSLPEKKAEEIRETLGKFLPEGAKILVATDGLKFGILRGLKPDTEKP